MAASSKRVIYAALIGNTLIALTKFVAASVTGSSAMLSEGVHSLVDTGNQVLLLFGLRKSSKAPNERFPYGYGKEIYFWSFVVAILIFALGAGISFYEGIRHLLHPHPVQSPGINYIVLTLALIFEGAAWAFALREFSRAKGRWGYLKAVQRSKNPPMFIVLFEDSAAMLGILVAFLGILLGQITGNGYWDGIASLCIGLILGGTAVWLAYETKGLLIGESAKPEVVQGIRRIALGHECVLRVHEVLTLHMGPEFVLVNIAVEFKDEATADQLEVVIADIDAQIKSAYPFVKRVFIEAEARLRRAGRRRESSKATDSSTRAIADPAHTPEPKN